MEKRKLLKLCQYGENCYRKNPIHFGEYSHPHLDKIYENGVDPKTKDYVIPDKYILSSEVIAQQLRLLEMLFPKNEKKGEATDEQVRIQDDTSGGYTLGYKDSHQKDSPDTKQYNSSQASTSANALGQTSFPQDTSKIVKKPKITKNIQDYIPVVLPKGKMAKKLENAAPYNMFLTAITDCKSTHHEPLTVTLQEILDESLGQVESSVQINFMVDIGWLLGHYYFAGIMGTPLLVLYGDETSELKTISQHQPKVTAVRIKMPTPFSTSHTKMMFFGYTDGSMRVVISTANLYEDDWHNRTQGIWISPRLPPLPTDADTAAGESQTGFRQDLLLYLAEYKLVHLQPWTERIRRSDFSSVNVFFIGSVPGGFSEGPRGHPWGHARLGSLLNKHAAHIDEKVPIICQSSSIGSLGPNIDAWVHHDFMNSLRKDSEPLRLRKIPPFKMIYPSFGNVNGSHDGLLGGGCLPYGKNTNDKQPWLKNYLHQWKSKKRFRSQAMPHIKSYTRLDFDNNSVYWFVLTSANLSKAAWGSFNKNSKIQPCLRIANFEAGVLFLPRFVIGDDSFPLRETRNDVPPFPLPYDVPLSPYGPDDSPFLMDYLH